MPVVRRFALVLCLLALPVLAFAQADMQITATDSPDPVGPDGFITYTITVTNAGPNVATSGDMSVYLNNTLLFQSITAPAGWTCPAMAPGSGAPFGCSAPAVPVGSGVFTLVLKAAKSQIGINDTTLNQLFTTSSSTSDPNNGNNSVTVQTAYVTPDADMQVTATDSPDPVAPDGNITYTVTVTNAGPDATTNAALSVFQNNTLLYQSITAPAGWTCPSLSPGYGGGFTCTNPSFAVGNAVFTVVLKAAKSQIGNNDTALNQLFTVGSDLSDPNSGNNAVTVQTAYVAPDADIQITASDSPDPVFPDGNITYTVTVTNAGPDPATNVSMSVYLNNTLLFQSITVPAGWNCSPPPVNGGSPFGCTASTLPLGSSVFTVVLKAAQSQLGTLDQTLNQLFTAGSELTDPNNGNNAVTVQTAYVTPDSDMQITASDSPDPVAPDGNITYTVTVTNAGPDTATNASMSVILNNTLLFQSITPPAGWTCPALAPNSGASFTCTNPSFATGSGVFTIVLKAAQSQFGINDQTINQLFTTGNSNSDPNNGNNAVTVQTAYVTPDADMQITATDSPDPVAPNGNITYTVTVTNAGPDPATNASMSVILNNTLLFQSITTPAGWTCPALAPNSGASFTCTNSTFATGSGGFTVVLKAAQSQFGNASQTINEVFTTGSAISDPNGNNNVVTVSTLYTVPQANLSVTASDAPDPVTPGNTITYTISANNAGPDAGANAHMVAPLQASLRFQSISAPAGWNCTSPTVGTNGIVDCTNASMATGPASFTLVTSVDPTLLNGPGGTIQQTFTVSSDAQDTVQANNSTTVTTTYTTPQADLAVTNADTPDPVAPGGTITYTQTVTNNGPDPAVSALITETLPASVGFQSIVVPTGWNCTTPAVGASGTITCTIASLANGGNATFIVTVSVIATNGTIGNTVTADSATYDPQPTNDSATVSTNILTPASADLSVTKTTNATSAPIGSTIVYTLTLHNNGPDAAASVVLTDPLPSSLLFQSITAPLGFTCTTPSVGSTGTITCTAATLANGATATFTLTTRVAANATGSITNTASASSGASDANSGNSSASSPVLPAVAAFADVSIAKTTTTTYAVTNSTITYTITVANAGPSPATNVTVTDDLPASLHFVSATPSQGTCNNTDPLSCALGTLNSGASATVTVQAMVVATSGTVVNSASVTSSESDPNAGNNSTTSPSIPIGSSVQTEPIPTLSEWALIAMALLLGVLALARMRV